MTLFLTLLAFCLFTFGPPSLMQIFGGYHGDSNP